MSPVRDGPESVRSEGVLAVNVDDLAPGEAVLPRQLGRHTQGVRQLRLAGAELAKDLGDGHGLQAAAQQLVELVGAGGDAENGLALGGGLQSGGEAGTRAAQLRHAFTDLLHFSLGQACR